MMKTLIYTFLILFISTGLFSQSITLYGLQGTGNPENPATISMDLVQIDPYTGTINSLFEISNSFAVASGSSTFDHATGTFIYWGPDDNNDYRLFSVDVDDQSTLLAPETTERAIELEYDLETGTTYGMLYDDATNTAFFGTVDIQNGTTQNITTISGLFAVAIGQSTYDSNNKRYMFYGVDSNHDDRLYTIDVQTGQVLSNPIINAVSDGDRISAFEYDNVNDKTYCVLTAVDPSQVDTFTFTYFRSAYLAEIDLASGEYSIIGETPFLEGFSLGVQVGGIAFDQGTSTYIMKGGTETGSYLFTINALTGGVISSSPITEVFGEIQVDNIAFANSFYVTSNNEGIEELNGIDVFPNPVSSELNIKLQKENISDLNIRIIDVLGREVLNMNIDNPNNMINIPTDKLMPGNYLITIQNEEMGTLTEKFLKK